MADNLFEPTKAKEKDSSAGLKLDLTIVDKGERVKESLSLLSISGIDARKGMADAGTSIEEIATASPVSGLRAEQNKKPERLSVGNQGDSLKGIFEDGVLKLYDEPGKSHFGFRFLDLGGTNKDHLAAGAARKEKFEDVTKGVTFEFSVKF